MVLVIYQEVDGTKRDVWILRLRKVLMSLRRRLCRKHVADKSLVMTDHFSFVRHTCNEIHELVRYRKLLYVYFTDQRIYDQILDNDTMHISNVL